jgi:hypothetical protein
VLAIKTNSASLNKRRTKHLLHPHTHGQLSHDFSQAKRIYNPRDIFLARTWMAKNFEARIRGNTLFIALIVFFQDE